MVIIIQEILKHSGWRFCFFIFTLIEIAVGLRTNSVAILADALHDAGDSFNNM